MNRGNIIGGLTLLLAVWVSQISEAEIRSGDLIFVGEGRSEFSKAIADATGARDSISFVHVGIVEVDEKGKAFVIEASPEEGVREIEMDSFLITAPLTVIKRLNIDYSVSGMLERAKSHLGEEYDWWYLPDNGKMYCSELVYESYIDENGHHIFDAHPMNFRAEDGSMPRFWIDLFEELGEPVPEGMPGTNPNDLSKSPNLIDITIF